ncbi:MAG: serine/threonine protein kinase [Myxococcales bacterium]|nr:serine/threonine protein kinase [Myxococcales bacterium]
MSSERASAPDPKDKLIGEVLANRYQIESRLGEGAMGAVYRARHVKVGRPFAVKVLHAKLLEDMKVAQRFEREAELAGRLRHANVIGVVDVGETTEGLRYMVMDFAEGFDLADLLCEAPMPPARIINLTRQLLEGLYHAHEQGLIHRDFKPENVIVEKDNHGVEVPRIVDFGIAILREGGDSPSSQGRLTTNGLVLGTPHYMAPEQAVADPIDHRIDLFALGIVVYEMLCGKLPFDGTGAEVARANLLLDPPLISQRVPYLEVDPLLEAFARRMMAKKRDHRPATAKAAREILDLIERDRAAAAAALGVPLAIAREAQVTQDNPPQKHVHEDSPSAQFSAAADPRTDAGSPAPVPRETRTSVTDPLDFDLPGRSKRTWIVAGLGLAVVGGIAAFALSRGGDKPAPATAPDDPKIVMPTSGTDGSAAPDTVTPDKVAVVDTAVPDKVVPDTVVPDKVVPDKVTPDRTRKTTPKLTGTKVTTTKVEPVAEVKPVVEEPKPATTEPNKTKVSQQYQAIGAKLKALGQGGDGIDEMWNLYRRIRIQNAMLDAAKLREAADILERLEKQLATRK